MASLVKFDIDRMTQDAEVSQATVRLLRRFTPSPLHAVVLVDIPESTAQRLFELAGMRHEFDTARRIGWEELGALAPVDRGSMLVLAGCLNDHGRMRGINAAMRTKAPQGNVAYRSFFEGELLPQMRPPSGPWARITLPKPVLLDVQNRLAPRPTANDAVVGAAVRILVPLA